MSTGQFVTFRIDDHLLGIDVLMVREINRVLNITPVQHAQDYVRGLINLRGQTVTVIDLGVRLGLGPRTIGAASHNVILKNDVVGLLVDSIGDVVQAEEDEVELPPANAGRIDGAFMDGVIKLKHELLVVLSTKKILKHGSSQERAGGQ